MKTYFDGLKEATRKFAWWKDGIQYVGTTGATLKEALADIAIEEKSFYLKQYELHKEKLRELLTF